MQIAKPTKCDAFSEGGEAVSRDSRRSVKDNKHHAAAVRSNTVTGLLLCTGQHDERHSPVKPKQLMDSHLTLDSCQGIALSQFRQPGVVFKCRQN